MSELKKMYSGLCGERDSVEIAVADLMETIARLPVKDQAPVAIGVQVLLNTISKEMDKR